MTCHRFWNLDFTKIKWSRYPRMKNILLIKKIITQQGPLYGKKLFYSGGNL